MSSDQHELSRDAQIEFLQKTIIRTDGYLNTANTKSTIMLSFSTALGTAICINAGEIIKLGGTFTLGIAISIAFLFASTYFSLSAIKPNLTPSKSANIFSFVDITVNYKEIDAYESRVVKINKLELIKEMTHLNYTLSHGLMKKFALQRKAVELIVMSLTIAVTTLFFALIAV